MINSEAFDEENRSCLAINPLIFFGESRPHLAVTSIQNIEAKMDVYKRILISKKLIDDFYLEDLNIDALARTSHLSKYYFLRVFKLVFGISPYQYILQKRFDYASALLLSDEHSVIDIAYKTGFRDLCSFSKAFKKKYKIPPSQFRIMKGLGPSH
ncbi:MAG TPA: AraC family transcriptional regulator [Chitinophagaceae bacterium]|jgi:AraC-like DNA-binding protein|nr:AraC family transcriptional regulator [Chitinophagaceae bacterium]